MSSTPGNEPAQIYYSAYVFDAVDFDRNIKCRGTLITIYDPNAAKGSDPYWKYKNTTINETHLVPRGFKAEVLDAWVGWTTLESA